jgi:regulator of protease activity HflC (stomatin/prohibitin superfamily)
MKEKEMKPMNGGVMLAVALLVVSAGVFFMTINQVLIGVILAVLGLVLMVGLMVVNPNESVVMVLFGSYTGTVKTNGFFWVNPFYSRKKITLRARNNESQPIKVNDKLGNPVMIGVVLVWKVEDTYSAAFEVDNYEMQMQHLHCLCIFLQVLLLLGEQQNMQDIRSLQIQ